LLAIFVYFGNNFFESANAPALCWVGRFFFGLLATATCGLGRMASGPSVLCNCPSSPGYLYRTPGIYIRVNSVELVPRACVMAAAVTKRGLHYFRLLIEHRPAAPSLVAGKPLAALV
jgi:hypothetical protein